LTTGKLQMGANRETISPKSPEEVSNPRRVPWSGSLLIAFDARPFARSLLKWYVLAVLVGYCAFIAWAESQYPAWLVWWLDLWAPAVDVFRHFLPIFDRFDSALAAKGVANRAPLIDHLIAVGWLMTLPAFSFLTWTVWRLSHEELVRFVTKVGSERLVIMIFGFIIFFLWTLVWIVYGFKLTSENPMFAFYRSNRALPGIGAYFGVAIVSGIGVQIALRALIVGGWTEEVSGAN
jgi:hypothetical protein